MIVHSSSICCYLSALASFRCRLYLCFCPLSRSLSPLQCQLETVGAHMQYRGKKTLKPRCLVYFSLSEHDRWKIEGGEKTFSAAATALKPWRAHCNQSRLHRRAVVHSGKSGWRTVVFQEERERMRENGSKWSWRAVEYCSLLLAVMNRPFGNRLGKLVPSGPRALSFSSVGSVRRMWKQTHTCGHTCMKSACTRWHTLKHACHEETILYDWLGWGGPLSSPWVCVLGDVQCIFTFNYDALILVLSFAADGDGW